MGIHANATMDSKEDIARRTGMIMFVKNWVRVSSK